MEEIKKELGEMKKMLRAVASTQSSLRQDILGTKKELREEIVELGMELKAVEKRLTERLNIQGSQLAYLEDDAPTSEEFGDLEKRVKKVETKIASV